MEAHRQREIKWMSLMSSNPASQARKTKKFRKLIMEGVPSSVRYLVWSYLTDGKARCVPGVYAQLCSRGRVPWSVDIERDIKSCFRDQPHLQGTQGPVLLLLQSYLNMVPDILYTRGKK
jgi:TBC1 domain family member 10